MHNLAIPPLPAIVAQVIQFDANNPKNGAADLEKLIIPDKAIGADLLRVSNSAFYGRSGKVKALRDALAVLGIKATKNLVIYLSTRTMSSAHKSEPFKKYLTRYPIFAALTAQAVASATTLKNQADEAFLAALLHSIGMNLLALEKAGHFSDMIDACEKNKWDLLKLEKQSYGVTHTEAGKQAAKFWNLPDIYQQLMEITPASDVAALKDPMEKLTFIAAVVSSALLEIPVADTARQNAQAVYQGIGGQGELFARYASVETFNRLKNHPFALLAGI